MRMAALNRDLVLLAILSAGNGGSRLCAARAALTSLRLPSCRVIVSQNPQQHCLRHQVAARCVLACSIACPGEHSLLSVHHCFFAGNCWLPRLRLEVLLQIICRRWAPAHRRAPSVSGQSTYS